MKQIQHEATERLAAPGREYSTNIFEFEIATRGNRHALYFLDRHSGGVYNHCLEGKDDVEVIAARERLIRKTQRQGASAPPKGKGTRF